jgi:curved DNA-binding protein CbpA
MNPYTELDVSVTASTEEIRQRYRTLAQMHHPDKGGDEELFKRIKLAYEILSDPIRRKQYDITGETGTTNAKDEAIANIIQIILHVVPNFNADEDDLIKIAEEESRAMLDMVNKDINNTEIQIKHFEKVLKKLRIKTNSENVLESIIQKQIQQRKKDLIVFHKNVKVCMLMLEILKDYEYGLMNLIFDKPEEENGAPEET